MKPISWFFALLFAAFLLLVALAALQAWRALPQLDGSLDLTVLEAPVNVSRDAKGLVTITAESENDAYRALGFIHAQDRFWQMEMTRRIGAGRLSEYLGELSLNIDRYTRTLGFHRLAAAQIASLDQPVRDALEAYAEGVNGWLNHSDTILPPELQVLMASPEPWSVTDSLVWTKLMSFQLSMNMRNEQFRSMLDARLPAELVQDILPGADPGEATTLPANAQALIDSMPALPDVLQSDTASNAWILDGSQTETGRPILANDPHLGFTAPNLWYFARIVTPGLTVTGVTAPGVPFHVLGHNGTVAWGMTTTYADNQDLFIETMSRDGLQYESPAGPQDVSIRNEDIQVRFGDPVRLTIRATRHGPVVSDLWAADRLVQGPDGRPVTMSLAFPGFMEADTTPNALYYLNRARDKESFLDALRHHVAPIQNIHYADTSGTIGLVAPGRIPIRKTGDGLRPVDGASGNFDWTGFVPFEEMPQWFNPPGGVIRNANNRLVPDTFPQLISSEWPPAFRADRLDELLAARGPRHSVTDSVSWQMDNVSHAARALLPYLLQTPIETDFTDEAIELLGKWDGTMRADRPEPLIYATWIAQLTGAISQDEMQDAATSTWEEREKFLHRVLSERQVWCDNGNTDLVETCAEILNVTLSDTLDALAETYGSRLQDWRWDEAHIAVFEHRLFERIPGLGALASQRIGTPGGDHTLNRGQAQPEQGPVFRHGHGAGYRAVYDLADLDRSMFSIAVGQSGNLFSPYYSNLLEDWRDGRYFRSDSRKDDIPSEPAHILTLTPQ